MAYDVAIVGGGPAGLAFAIESAQRGFSTVVLERQALPCDKACGEGLLPAGVRALDRLGARALLSERDCIPIRGIRYLQEDGSAVEGTLPHGGGLGVRRIALVEALSARARASGAELREHTALRQHSRAGGGFRLETDAGSLDARLLVAADGLASPLRRAEGLEVAAGGPRRYGLRQHFELAPWTPFVEVYFSDVGEAYVTPVGTQRVGVAFLWEAGRVPFRVSFAALLARFPALADRLKGAEPDSSVRGAGPLARRAGVRVADQLVLLGDAAGYLDAITGEGLSLAFGCAGVLGALLPSAMAHGATREALWPYERAFVRAFRRYAWVAGAMVAMARRPAIRKGVLKFLARHPWLFERLLSIAT